MLASLTRTKTFWIVVVVMFGYGIITWGDDDGSSPKRDGNGDDMVNVVFEVAMVDPKANSIQVAISATLGSAGRLAVKDAKIWDGLRYVNRNYTHPFRARRGDPLNAEVVNKGAPVGMMSCFFWQQDQGDETIPGKGGGYGDITGPHLDAVSGATLARCAATVR